MFDFESNIITGASQNSTYFSKDTMHNYLEAITKENDLSNYQTVFQF